MMMIDVDFPDDGISVDEEAFISSIKAKLAKEIGRSFLLFQTAGGLRAICTNQTDGADSPETLRLMERVGADPLDVRLCKGQKCFRSRITPKPWRISPAVKLPDGDPSDLWIAMYEKHSFSYGVCRFLGRIGQENILPKLFDALAIHNQTICTEEIFIG